MLTGRTFWRCQHGAKCFTHCEGCPDPDNDLLPPLEQLIVPCKMCHGQGFVSIRNGEDAADCPRCDGSGRER